MNGINLVLDTNAVIALLNGDSGAIGLTHKNVLFVSFIVELESQSYQKLLPEELKLIKQFLNECVIVDINRKIKETAIYFQGAVWLEVARRYCGSNCVLPRRAIGYGR